MLERKLPEMDMRLLVDLPAGLDYNEWLASHSKFRFTILFVSYHGMSWFTQLFCASEFFLSL